MKHIVFFSILASVLVLGAGSVSAQELPSPPTPSQSQERRVDYEVGPGDQLSISVSGLREFTQSTRVSNSGRIRVPYVGVMFVAGMTAVEVEREVASLIKEHELINEPTVRVLVLQYRAQPTYVIGAVNSPGQFAITGEMYLLDLLSKAGGLLDGADSAGFLYRRSPRRPGVQTRILTEIEPAALASSRSASQIALSDEGGEGAVAPKESQSEEVIKINLEELREGRKPELNLRLQGGDVVYVPRRRQENIYVIGDVKVPGGYSLPRRSQVTAAQAIIYAGGALPTAKTGKGFLMRRDAAGEHQVIPVNFAAIIAGKTPDIPVRPDDIIFIPNSAAKEIGVGLMNMLPTIIQQWLIF